jgi:hypothetical protein
MSSPTYFDDPIEILNTSGTSLIIGGGTIVGGDFNVNGTIASFADNIILINANPTNSSDTGVLFGRHSSDIDGSKNFTGIIYSEILDEFNFGYLSSDPSRVICQFVRML